MKKIAVALACIALYACPMTTMADKSDDIQKEIDEYQEDLDDTQSEIEDTNAQIDDLEAEIGKLTSEIESKNIEAEQYRQAMATRIRYFYESGLSNASALDIVFSATSFSDMLNRVSFLQQIYSYDAEQMQEYTDLINANEEEKDRLTDATDQLTVLLSEQEDEASDLEDKISEKETELEEAKEQEEKERLQKEQEEAEQSAQASGSSLPDEVLTDPSSSGSGRNWTSSDGRFVVINGVAQESGRTSGGAMTKQKGVVYFNGHKETYYSQRVLAGGGLHIPGRHVNSKGLVCDGDGYICLASSDYPHDGTVAVLTSLGWGKVYDCGCASGTIDIYVDW